MSTSNRKLLLAFATGLLLSASVGAYNWFFPIFIKHGEVVARGLVKGPSGAPIFVVYGEDGQVASEIGEATGDLANAFVISGSTYQAYVDQMNDILSERQPIHKGARVMTRDDYNAATFKTIDEKHVLTKPDLAPSVVSVIVRGQQTLLRRDDNPLIMQSPINLFNVAPLGGDIKSILFNQQGDVVQKSTLNIGYKAEFYEEPGPRRKPISPIQGVFVEGPNAAIGGISGDLTNQKGQYTFTVIYPSCPGFAFEYSTPVFAHLYYRNFNPRGQRFGTYYIMKPGYDWCVGYSAYPPGLTLTGLMAQIDAMAIEATMAIPLDNTKFQIDVMMLTGEARVAHGVKPVEVGGATEYKYEQPDTSPVIHQEGADDQGNPLLGYDFDGDGKPDKAVRGKLQLNQQTNKEEFVADAEGTLQGIYLSSGDRKPDATEPEKRQPDFTRLMDKQSDFSHQGLLSRISVDDLKKTDLYVFRESNGMLITERRGLKAEEAIFNTGDYNERDNKIYYKVLIRGPKEGNMMRLDFEGWQARSKMNPALQVRQADHLRPGENVRLVLINRATGYIGTMTTQLKGADSTPGNTISFPISEIYMNPPNLSVRAVRKTKIEQGLTKDEDREYLIGFEGGATSHDNVIEVFTEWYDADGRPLPEELGEFGYTGRLAKIVGDNQLAAEGGELANFTIKPGKHRQLIRIKDDAITKEHYYIHINGEVKDRNPDFSTLGAGAGPLQSRPAHYVPFKVPVFDEKATIEARLAWKKARDEGQVTGRFPLPVYRFVYRPEMQFSLFDLQMRNIRHGRDGQDGVDILNAQTPGVSNIDDFVRLSYNLMANDLAPLPLLGAQRELIFAVGEQELAATMGSDRQLHFRNLSHLASLAPEDFLTMRLYYNHDPENVLWQFAFEFLALDATIVGSPQQGGGVFRVSADNPKVPLVSWLVGYAQRDPKYKSPKDFTWDKRGNGWFEKQQQDQDNGVFTSELNMPTIAGARTTVIATVKGNPDLSSEWGEVVVVPGKPARVETDERGDMHIAGFKTKTITVRAWDRHGNRVADGTPVEYYITGPVKIINKASAFSGGVAMVELAGTSYPDTTAKVEIAVGDQRKTVPLEVKPLVVTWENFPGTFDIKTKYPLAVKVTTPDGEPASNVSVVFDATFGKLERALPRTGGDGIAHIEFYSGLFKSEGTITARVELQEAQHKQGKVAPSTPQAADTSKTIVVGDESQDGVYEFQRFDGRVIGVPFKAQAPVAISGAANSQHTVKLGSLAEPNRAPIAAYYFNYHEQQTAPDETGLHDARTQGITVLPDHPLGIGESYYFNSEANVQVPQDTRLQPSDGLGFRVDAKPQADGTLFKLAGNAHSLQYTNGRFEFRVKTSAGDVSVQSSPVAANEWHSVAGRVYQGKLELEVDGVAATPQDVSGTLQYGFGVGVHVGGFTGNLSSLQFYDWRTQPLLVFADNDTEQLIATIPANGESVSINVRSTAQLNAAQSDSELKSLRVGLTTGSEQHYVSLVSKAFYGEMMGVANSNAAGAPALAFDYSPGVKHVPVWDAFMPVAHAGVIDWLAENAWNAFTTLIGFAIPFNEARGVIEQLGYMMNGEWDRVNWVTFTLDTIGLFTFIPVAKPLKLVLTPLRKFIGPLGTKPFVKQIGSVIRTIFDKFRKGNFDDIAKIVPYFLLVGELAADEEGREALMAMVDSIGSADDFFAWVDYLSLPATGWDGDGEPPPVDTALPAVDNPVAVMDFNYQMQAPQFFDAVVPRAYAAPTGLARVGATLLKKFLLQAIRASGQSLRDNPQALSKVLKELREAMVTAATKKARKLAFNPKFLSGSLKYSVKNAAAGVTALFTGKSNARLHPAVIVALFAYLEDRMTGCVTSRRLNLPCKEIPKLGEEIQVAEGIKHRSELHVEIDALLFRVVQAAAMGNLTEEDDAVDTENTTWLHPFGQGDLWHAFMIAVMHARFEVTGTNPIIAIERNVPIELYVNKKGSKDKYESFDGKINGNRVRRVDIELKTEEKDPNGYTKTKWIEVKSHTNKADDKLDCAWRIWSINGQLPKVNACSSKAAYHKQFFFDARAEAPFTTENIASARVYAASNDWWLQVFKTEEKQYRRKDGSTVTIRAEKSYSNSSLGKIKQNLRTLPPEIIAKQMLKNPDLDRNSRLPQSFINSRFHMFSVPALVKDELMDSFAKDFPQEIVADMIKPEVVD